MSNFYKNPVCRGSYALGSACGQCERCNEEREKWQPQNMPTTVKEVLEKAKPLTLYFANEQDREEFCQFFKQCYPKAFAYKTR